ncbi:MAG: DegT/DnrJ/EryC1/StrS family aminotransferase [Candidatus Omnitrophota bacterium]
MAQLAIKGGTPVRTEPFPPWPVYGEPEKEALIRTLESREWGIGSPAIKEFEEQFAAFCGAKYAAACTNGTEAISIALQAMGVGPGDEAIIPPYTFIATAIGVLACNAIPVFADIHPETYNIDPEAVRRAVTPRTKVIIPVHIAGNPADMDGIMAIAQEHNLLVLEDAAQAHGAEWKGRRVGAIGNAGTFSFQTTKNLSSGEGGAIVSNDEELADRIRSFVNCGRVKGGAWYDHHEMGGNHRLGAFQAAVLLTGMERIEEQMQKREENFAYLSRLFEDIEGVSFTGAHAGTTRRAHHLGVIRYQPEAFKNLPKPKFAEALEKEGIPCSTGYLPLQNYSYFQHFAEKTPAYASLYAGKFNFDPSTCPVCVRVCEREGVWLFQNMFLGTKKDMEDIAEAITKIQQYAEEAL